MQAEYIESIDDLRFWLNGLPESVSEDRAWQIAVTLAHRAAMRVWPFWLSRASIFELPNLPICQPLLVSEVAAQSPATELLESVGARAASSASAARDASARIASGARAAASASAAASARAAAAASASTTAAPAAAYAASAASAACDALDNRAAAATYSDAQVLQRGGNIWAEPLWQREVNPLAGMWENERQHLSADPHWAFWIDWYDRALQGRPQDWDLLQKIALQEPDFWDGTDAEVNARIADVVAGHRRDTDPTDISGALQTVPVTKNAIKSVKAGIARHRADLPPTFDAIEGFISLEVHRLQKKNVCDELEAQEVRRQIGVLLTLHTAIDGLRKTIPAAGDVAEKQAEEATKLLTLYKTKLASLPRDKVDDLAAGVWAAGGGMAKVGLIFTSTAMFGFFGLPASLGFAAGAMAFAPKQSADLIKGAKEWFKSSSGTGT